MFVAVMVTVIFALLWYCCNSDIVLGSQTVADSFG